MHYYFNVPPSPLACAFSLLPVFHPNKVAELGFTPMEK